MLNIASTLTIAPHRRITVLRYGDQHMFVLTGGPQDVCLGWLPQPLSSSSP